MSKLAKSGRSRLTRSAGLAGTLALAWALSSPADAAILSVVGMEILSTPVSLVEGATESSTAIRILDEGASVLTASVSVNAVGPGTHTYAAGPPLAIPAGSIVHSYIVHLDPDGGVVALTGSVTFDVGEMIIGIMTHTPYLDASDGVVGDPMAIYPTGVLPFRAFETLPGTDTVTIAGDLNSASFALVAELGVDQARIITTVIPAPSAVLPFVATVMLARRKRRERED